MQLPQQTIIEFRKAYYQDFGEELTEQEAKSLGQDLLTLMAVIYRSRTNH
jgi:hypothetical protein